MSDKNTVFQQKNTINAGGQLVDFSQPKVMGIINITPDSFYGGSRAQSVQAALAMAGKMLSEGAAILDIGAYSSRPGADDISPEEEASRLLPVIRAIKTEFPEVVLSVDTFRASVAAAAVAEGAQIINDISGGELDDQMFKTVAKLQVPYILMHMKGTPRNMNDLAVYQDVVAEVIYYFTEKIHRLRALQVHDIILDPGFGFAKSKDHNFELLARFDSLKILGLSLLAGLSRKRTVWETLGVSSNEALNGTTVLNTVALMKGASLLRVHDVKEAAEAVKLLNYLI